MGDLQTAVEPAPSISSAESTVLSRKNCVGSVEGILMERRPTKKDASREEKIRQARRAAREQTLLYDVRLKLQHDRRRGLALITIAILTSVGGSVGYYYLATTGFASEGTLVLVVCTVLSILIAVQGSITLTRWFREDIILEMKEYVHGEIGNIPVEHDSSTGPARANDMTTDHQQ
jgi:hypothetical protein